VKAARTIASIGDSALRRVQAWHGAADSQVFTMLAAIRHFHEATLGDTLRELPVGEKSPLAKLPHVHLARWLVIDQLKTDWPGAPRRTPRLNSAYLLFSASLAVPRHSGYRFPRTFVNDIRTEISDTADEIWGHCMGYPGTKGREDFVDYFLSSRVHTGIHQFGYPGVTVDDVRCALKIRSRFADFALTHQGESGEPLKMAYLEESVDWCS
jgi:hypothetical protein